MIDNECYDCIHFEAYELYNWVCNDQRVWEYKPDSVSDLWWAARWSARIVAMQMLKLAKQHNASQELTDAMVELAGRVATD